MACDREPLFDEQDRNDPTPARHQESTFEFLNRIAGDYWDQPRSLMQAWLNHVTADTDYNDLRQRLRSRDDEQFRSAYLELYLHESLIRAGYTVTIHPKLPGTSSRPDFLAERDRERIYVEAIAPGSTPAAKAAAQRRAVLLDTVNQLDDPNFILWLDELTEGQQPPPAARMRADLGRWLAGLDPDDHWDLDDAPTYTWQHEGWSVRFKPIPIKPEARGRGGDHHRAIGVYAHTEVGWIDDAPAVRKALTGKHHQYGQLDAPFVIAVGTYIFDRDRWHTTNALYGAAAIELGEARDEGTVTRQIRRPDGYFGTPPTWQNRNVSGVLVVNQLMPYYVQRAEVTLWRHPNPMRTLPERPGLPGNTLILTGDRLSEIPPERTADELFGLPEHWPDGDPWPAE